MPGPSLKLTFALALGGDWPPVSTESVWCEQVGTGFRLRNAPFFINGLAVDDIFDAVPDPVNDHIFEFSVKATAGHSLVWILNNTLADASDILAQLRALGCSTEGFQKFSLHSVDVPPEVSKSCLSALLDAAESEGLDLAFPVWRHE